mgnify:FL=1
MKVMRVEDGDRVRFQSKHGSQSKCESLFPYHNLDQPGKRVHEQMIGNASCSIYGVKEINASTGWQRVASAMNQNCRWLENLQLNLENYLELTY